MMSQTGGQVENRVHRTKSKLGFQSSGEHCCAIDCAHKRATHACTFYSFPKEKKWYDIWVNAVKRCKIDEAGKAQLGVRWEPQPHHRLCACHFSKPPNPRSRKVGWNHVEPDLLPGSKFQGGRPTFKSTNRTLQSPKKRPTKVPLDGFMATSEGEGSGATEQPVGPPLHNEQTDTQMDNRDGAFDDNPYPLADIFHDATFHDHDYITSPRGGRVAEQFDIMKKHVPEFQEFLDEYQIAKEKADRLDRLLAKGQILNLENVKLNNKEMKYLTGFPSYDTFTVVFQYLKYYAEDMQYRSQIGNVHHAECFQQKPGRARALTLEEEFFATLVRLRVGLPSRDCARFFGIAEGTFSNLFNTWVILIAQELERICSLPNTEDCTKSQASCFDGFENVRIVLDCTEVFSQTPGNLNAHQQVHSNYKHHSTIKFLVGISPNGAIIYVSKMWGGRASDKKITSHSQELLEALDSGDSVMVDRGFTIASDLPQGVKLLIPPFKNKQTGQFTAAQLHYSEKISQARIHVERAMRAIKEYRLLETEVKLAMIGNYENIFKACAYLVNFKSPFLKRKE